MRACTIVAAKYLIAICTVAICLPYFAQQALALTAREAETVVGILEKLKAENVQIAYDQDAADEWFEQDADRQKLITKAGLNQKTWKVAVDETMTGFFASIPEAEIKTIFDNLRKRLEATPSMTAAQKTAMREMLETQYKEINDLRTQGKPFAAIVTPLTPRLRKLAFE